MAQYDGRDEDLRELRRHEGTSSMRAFYLVGVVSIVLVLVAIVIN